MKKLVLHHFVFIVVVSTSVGIFTSCRQETEIIADSGDQINLIADLATKGAVETTSSISEFVTFGYSHGHTDWVTASTTSTSNLMFNNKYTKSGSSWTGSIKTQWPDNEFKRYSFFAYSPFATAANKITLLTSVSTNGYQKLSYQTLPDVASQVDLILASRLNQTPAKEVPLYFSHSLSRIGFCAYSMKSGVTIKSISINGVKYKGDIEVRGDGDWSNISPDQSNFTATINSGVISTDVNNPTLLTGTGGANYFILLPQDLTSNTNKSICITVVTTKDGKDRSLNYTITQNYQKGKSLLYKLYINGDVDLAVNYTVSDWTSASIPTDINTTFLTMTPMSSVIPTVINYSTDYTGTVIVKEVGKLGVLSIVHDAINKTISVNTNAGGLHQLQVIAGNITGTIEIVNPISFTSTPQVNLNYLESNNTVNITSTYPWSASSSMPDVLFAPSSGNAGADQIVTITVPLNTTRSARNIPVTFTSTNGKNTKSVDWGGSQIANPNYHLGRFAGSIITKSIDANTTRSYYSKQLFAAPADESGLYTWALSATSTSSTSLIDGKANSAQLVTSSYPAGFQCNNKPGGGWYLPAQYQLTSLWFSKYNSGTFTGSIYLSSTEISTSAAAASNLNQGLITMAGKNVNAQLRCVREEIDNTL